MQVICTDGTILQCDRFEAIDSGVLLFNEEQGRQGTEAEESEEAGEEMDEEEASAFVPLHQLRIVLPDSAQQGRSAVQSMGQTTSQPTQAPPTGAGIPPQGQAPTQPSPRGQPPQQGGGPGQGRR